MFEAIRGILKEKEPSRAVVETAGISYRLSIPLSTYTKLPPLETTAYFFLSQVVREDAHTLYAFLVKEERDLFEMLISLSGIGPKTAVAIIGHIEFGMFQKAIAAADLRILSKIPGVGKKTAERLIIEMRNKLKLKESSTHLLSACNDLASDAIRALLNLGYNPLDAQKAVTSALQEGKEGADLSHLISAALQKVSAK